MIYVSSYYRPITFKSHIITPIHNINKEDIIPMNWMHKLPLKQRIVAGCYLVAALFAIPVLVTFMILGNIILGIVLVDRKSVV